MGKEKTTTVVNQTSQATPTEEEKRLNQLEIQGIEATQPGQIEIQKNSTNLINKLLLGETNLPGFFGELGNGISEDMVTNITRESLKDLYPQFESSGILDSGTAASVSARTAGDIRRASAEYNLNNKLNLLNLAFSGQGQVQQPMLTTSAGLGNRLAGLRSVNSQGTSTQYGMNPFLKSFQTSFGSGLGSRMANFK